MSSPANRERPPPVAASATSCDDDMPHWASLHADLVSLVGWRVLAGDPLDYVSFRAVCTYWRSATSVCGYTLREEGKPHDCLKDAEAAMNLVTAKLKDGFNDPIEIAENSVPESDQMTLLAHRIPVYLLSQELLKIFSWNPSIEEKIDSRIRGEFYSTRILFKDIDEADKAFDELDGQETKDTSGRLQKSVLLKRDNGDVAGFFVRKMVYGSRVNNPEVSKKRPQPTDNGEQKKEDVHGDKQKRQRTSKKHRKKAKNSWGLGKYDAETIL